RSLRSSSIQIGRPTPRSTLFPYTRSSDLGAVLGLGEAVAGEGTQLPQRALEIGLRLLGEARTVLAVNLLHPCLEGVQFGELLGRDRKSTRLNSSHQIISYAAFCLNKTATP